MDYDALVLATGSYAFVPPVPGHDLPACFVYRTIEDLDAIRADAQRTDAAHRRGRGDRRRAAGPGGGQRAAALGLDTHVVEIRAAADGAAARRRRRRAAAVG